MENPVSSGNPQPGSNRNIGRIADFIDLDQFLDIYLVSLGDAVRGLPGLNHMIHAHPLGKAMRGQRPLTTGEEKSKEQKTG